MCVSQHWWTGCRGLSAPGLPLLLLLLLSPLTFLTTTPPLAQAAIEFPTHCEYSVPSRRPVPMETGTGGNPADWFKMVLSSEAAFYKRRGQRSAGDCDLQVGTEGGDRGAGLSTNLVCVSVSFCCFSGLTDKMGNSKFLSVMAEVVPDHTSFTTHHTDTWTLRLLQERHVFRFGQRGTDEVSSGLGGGGQIRMSRPGVFQT